MTPSKKDPSDPLLSSPPVPAGRRPPGASGRIRRYRAAARCTRCSGRPTAASAPGRWARLCRRPGAQRLMRLSGRRPRGNPDGTPHRRAPGGAVAAIGGPGCRSYWRRCAARRPALHPAADHRVPRRARAGGGQQDLHLLGRVNTLWLVVGLVLEGASLFCYGLLTRTLLPPGSVTRPVPAVPHRSWPPRPSRTSSRPARGQRGIGYRLFTAEGIKGQRRRGDDGHQGPGLHRRAERPAMAVPGHLHPARGLPPIYVTVAITGAVLLLAIAALAFGITRRTERASRILHAVRGPDPRPDRRPPGAGFPRRRASLSRLARDRRTLATSLTWAWLNWLLDAASLWCFVAAFGRFVEPGRAVCRLRDRQRGRCPARDSGRARRDRLGGPVAAGQLRRHPQRGHARRARLGGW